MSETVQYIIVAIIVVVAIIAVARMISSTSRGEKSTLNACVGCKLQDVCQKRDKISAKKCADKVAQVEK
jgi:membrane protein implicated in regulation of membrane protease activity